MELESLFSDQAMCVYMYIYIIVKHVICNQLEMEMFGTHR